MRRSAGRSSTVSDSAADIHGATKLRSVDARGLSSPVAGQGVHVAVVTVSYNTVELTAFLLWSLHRILEWPELEILVVDNGSTDGSREMLTEAADAGLCTLIPNTGNPGHGPGLNLAMGTLRRRSVLPDRVWILDSDCVVTRSDVLSAVFAGSPTSGAAIVGEPHWDPWHGKHRFELYSLLIDPARTLTTDREPFTADGDPAIKLLDATGTAGHRLAAFPFTRGHFLVHLGRGTLASVVEADEAGHPLYEWAIDHHEPHFGGVEGARDRYVALQHRFRAEVGTPVATRLVATLRRDT